ncbi:MAG: hypothetical protein ACTSRH_12830 [Promethearchaeota archaeon]
MAIFIDTEIWVFAQKVPEHSRFQDKHKYQLALQLHQKSNKFLSQIIKNNNISMTYHQLCEIFHSLAFRGNKLPREIVLKYCIHLSTSEFINWYSVSNEHIRQAMELSSLSKIHVWDYICILPLYKDIDMIYSCDAHFKHETFKSLGVKIENPIGIWIPL